MAGGIFLLAHIISSLCALPPLIAALLIDEWYVVLSLTAAFKVGLSSYCDNGDSNYGISESTVVNASTGNTTASPSIATEVRCTDVDYPYLADLSCGRVADDIQSRFNATKAFVILALIFAAAQGIAALLFWILSLWLASLNYVHLAVSFLSFLFSIIAVAVFAGTMESWLFCGQKYCDYLDSEFEDCNSYVGYGFISLCCALIILFFALLALILSLVFRGDEDPDEARRRAEANRSRKALQSITMEPYQPDDHDDEPQPEYEMVGTGKRRRKRYPNEPDLPLELQDGDWEYDPNTGYFWSEERQLYFEPETKQFYDPYSDSWFNPDTGLWYKPLVEEEDDIIRPQGEVEVDE